LLTEIDGIESLEDVFIIGTTNRPDLLDPSLLRPGRFDNRIFVPPPDRDARFQIFKIHTRKMPLAKSIDRERFLMELANRTDGYSGADIEAVCREAAMLALREDINAKVVERRHFEEALKKIKPSISKFDLSIYEREIEEKVRTYYHR
ncbi:MAG TPA: AAA family ATPase, partial [Candidatus Altiarchaeales archaeon]|nr:AAA family ATPase [Candidatus Altiarchaeales archaeon]